MTREFDPKKMRHTAERQYARGYRAGRRFERARIIAWLKEQHVCNYEGVEDYAAIVAALELEPKVMG